jgi:glyoxylase-like metal-dependent hydrolase (beta-lactamase superfamily II)
LKNAQKDETPCEPASLKRFDRSRKMEIAPGIHKLNVSMANSPLANLNCYLIEGKTGWTMIDTGFFIPESFDSLKAVSQKR